MGRERSILYRAGNRPAAVDGIPRHKWLDCRTDVLVHAEQVGRIVFGLEHDQPRIIAAIGASGAVLASSTRSLTYAARARCGSHAAKSSRVQPMLRCVSAGSVQPDRTMASY